MLPEDPTKRLEYASLINRTVQLKREIDLLKSDILTNKEYCKEMFGKGVSEDFIKVVNTKYEKSKIEAELEKSKEVITELDILFGK